MENMDLRDKFACFALTEAMRHEFLKGFADQKIIAANAYTMADAMLAARKFATKKERIEWACKEDSDEF